jgi:hypothetical protein
MAIEGEKGVTPKGFRSGSLDALNFLLADVRGALGPYLNVFLVTRQHWSQEAVGLVTAIGGWVGLALQTPAGALIDSTRAKRGLIVAALVVLATRAVTTYAAPVFWPVMARKHPKTFSGADCADIGSAEASSTAKDFCHPRCQWQR